MDGEFVPLAPTLIVEDDPATRQRLARLVGGITGEAGNVMQAGTLAEAHAHLRELRFALVLVDIGLPDGDGNALVAWIAANRPETPTIVVSAWGHDELVLDALRAGAVGYLLKERDDIELALSLRSVQRGGAPIDPGVARGILAQLQAPTAAGVAADGSGLTEREAEILGLVARGLSNREIAEHTALSRLTIEGYTKSIYRKLAVHSRTAAVFAAKNRGLLR